MMRLKLLFLLNIFLVSSPATAQIALWDVFSCDLANGKRISMGIHGNFSHKVEDAVLVWQYGEQTGSLPVTQVYTGEQSRHFEHQDEHETYMVAGSVHQITFIEPEQKRRISALMETGGDDRLDSHFQNNIGYSVVINRQEILCKPNTGHFNVQYAKEYFSGLEKMAENLQ